MGSISGGRNPPASGGRILEKWRLFKGEIWERMGKSMGIIHFFLHFFEFLELEKSWEDSSEFGGFFLASHVMVFSLNGCNVDNKKKHLPCC